jgi:hypothetical protein
MAGEVAEDAGAASLMRQARPLIAARLFTAILTLSIPLVLARVLPLAEYGTYKQLFLIALTLSSVLPFGVGQSLYYFIPAPPTGGSTSARRSSSCSRPARSRRSRCSQ